MTTNTNDSNDMNIVEIWLRKDPVRWVAGALAGVLAGVVALLFAMILSSAFGGDYLLPAKFAALPILGPEALDLASQSAVLMLGVGVHLAISVALGILFAHFTGTNRFSALFGVGLTWGVFSWIFIHNLFTPSFRSVFVAGVPSGAAFFVCLVFGVSLCSVAIFDRVLRRD